MRTIEIDKHNGWGNSIYFSDYAKMKVAGHLRERPEVGDRLEAKLQSGKIGVFEFIEVKLMRDPPDQFFATVKPLGYKADLENNQVEEQIMEKVTAKSYSLYTDNGAWLGQVVLTSDGMFSAVTDYGNFGYAWRAYGDDFGKFLSTVGVDYFATKIATGMDYVARGKAIDKACQRFAEKILPALQEVLKLELLQKEQQ